MHAWVPKASDSPSSLLSAECAALTDESRDRRSFNSGTGFSGGAWSHCLHLRHYGLNMDFGLAGSLLSLRPRSALELGCGLGLYTGFLHSVAGTTPAVGVEPMPMPSIGFRGATQLIANLLVGSSNESVDGGSSRSPATAAAAACEATLGAYDLVFSIEVAEHLPLSMHAALADLLVRHVSGFLVFSAGRIGQPGVGHIGNRPADEWIELFTSRGLIPLPRTTKHFRGAARNHEHRVNLLAFAARGAPLGRAHDEEDPAAWLLRASEQRGRPGYPPSRLAHLSDPACAGVVSKRIEGLNRDACNATHGVFLGSKQGNLSAPLPASLAPNGRVPWMAKARLRTGELELWPELIIEHARCYAYRPLIRERLMAALNVSSIEEVVYSRG